LFGLDDIWTFFLAFFLTLPIVTIIHELGHVLVARIFGAKIRFVLGVGNTLLKLGPCEVKSFYFMEAWCQHGNLKYDTKFARILIYLAGSVFNLIAILMVNSMIYKGLLPANIFFYQFVYFSVYFIFFSMLPFKNGAGNPSDGLAIYEVIKYGKSKDPID